MPQNAAAPDVRTAAPVPAGESCRSAWRPQAVSTRSSGGAARCRPPLRRVAVRSSMPAPRWRPSVSLTGRLPPHRCSGTVRGPRCFSDLAPRTHGKRRSPGPAVRSGSMRASTDGGRPRRLRGRRRPHADRARFLSRSRQIGWRGPRGCVGARRREPLRTAVTVEIPTTGAAGDDTPTPRTVTDFLRPDSPPWWARWGRLRSRASTWAGGCWAPADPPARGHDVVTVRT
ncbi:MAG: hypothetical protein JWQ92_2332 [Amnibacterium sp.]|nr:hypothetical protein [Amnibacterium sp.]